MKIAVYPGSFDPISNGHLDIIERSSKVFDKVYVLCSINPNKKYSFTTEERVEMLKYATKHLDNVIIASSDKLMLEFVHEVGATVIIRGIRNIMDYENEITRFQFNRSIDNEVDTFVLFPSQNNLFLSSSSIKELVKFGSDISNYVPQGLAEKITTKLKANEKVSS